MSKRSSANSWMWYFHLVIMPDYLLYTPLYWFEFGISIFGTLSFSEIKAASLFHNQK